MNSSGRIEEVAVDPKVVDASQGHASVYISSTHGHFPPPSTAGSKALSWDLMQITDNGSSENGSTSGYHHDQQKEFTSVRDFQDGSNAASGASTSSNLVSANGPHDYAGYTSYPNSTDPYGYGNPSYPSYYYGYQQQPTHPYSQQGVAYQNPGAPYQPLNSFQNTGSYVGPTTSSYSSTYYNAGDYQNTGAYQNSGYNQSVYSNQTSTWNDGSYGNYLHHQYSNYTSPDTNGPQSSSAVAANSLQYQEHYKQWADYYSQTASDVSCAPGTENMPVSTTTSLECPIPGVGDGFAASNSQPPPPGTLSSWSDSSSSELHSFQPNTAIADAGWKFGTPGYENHPQSQMSSSFQKPLDSVLHYDNCQDQQKSVCSQGSNLQFPATHQVSQSFHPPLQTVSVLDSTRRVSKLQIPTNPRITPALPVAMPKSEKDSVAVDAASKPAYISVSMPRSNSKVTFHDTADDMLKPGMFPTSLRAYVERALSRCKDDSQKAACQEIMKEMITKASHDGTLFTRDWDTEPLFPLPTTIVNKVNDNPQSPVLVSPLPKVKKSPSRRTKSRWEPIAEDKLMEKLASVNHISVKDGAWDHLKERDNMASAGKSDSKDNSWSNIKFFQSQQQILPNKNNQRPIKKQRFGDQLNTAENGDASSESDKESGLTAYYSSAVALTDSPEERKRRENRSKRFEKREHRSETKLFRPKVVGAGNSTARRASASLLGKSHEDGCDRAVEDIDWDALTVRGTCQEIEKRYLRLTSAPDPSTVRPEEVLEKALSMVQSSEKNYLYKCDQLKSIRQDLTVQRIHNELTVKVYETHARLALEAGDLPEYNQCQSQLKGLYAEGIKGCYMEFSAYNLLCVIMHSNNNRDLVLSMASLSMEAKRDDAVKHALAVRAAVTSGNYILFFRLYRTAPNLNSCVMDLYVEKMRFEAVRCMSRAYRPTVPLGFIAQVLGFAGVAPVEGNDEKDPDGLEECQEWLKAHGASLTVDNNGELQLDTKVTASSLYMPDPDDAVAHGDSSLAVNDFLTRTS